MPSIETNIQIWNEGYDWTKLGDEWSQAWGGEDIQWYGVILPRIQAYLTEKNGNLQTGTILEIAPGFGRWTKYLKNFCEKLVVVDLSEKCIEACQIRFKDCSNLEYHVNDGKSLEMIEDNSLNFAFSMDSLVHAEEEAIAAYLEQLPQKLTRNGIGFIHHSNYEKFVDVPGHINQHMRATTMSAEKFKRLAEEYQLKCLSQELVNWGCDSLIDSFSVVAKQESDWNISYKMLENNNFMQEAAHLKKLSELYGNKRVYS